MTVNMTFLVRGRALGESLMQDTCTITVAGDDVYDPEQMKTVPGERVPIYTGKCRIQTRDLSAGSPMVADDTAVVSQYVVQLPISAPNAPSGALVTNTASAHDPANVARRFAVKADQRKTHASMYRLFVEELQ